jgi:hypothetical protein
MVWWQGRHIRDPEYPTLEFEVVPELEIVLMQANRRTGRLLDRTGRQKVVEMSMRMQDAAHGETQLLYFLENSLRRTAGIDDDRLLRNRITNNRAVTTEGWNREGLPNQGSHHTGMLQSNELEAQASRPWIHYG